jgi:hypothetical protein
MDGDHDEELRAERLFQRRKEGRDDGRARHCDCQLCSPRTDAEAKIGENLNTLNERFLESLRRPN